MFTQGKLRKVTRVCVAMRLDPWFIARHQVAWLLSVRTTGWRLSVFKPRRQSSHLTTIMLWSGGRGHHCRRAHLRPAISAPGSLTAWLQEDTGRGLPDSAGAGAGFLKMKHISRNPRPCIVTFQILNFYTLFITSIFRRMHRALNVGKK
jgi:hypothetical protein